MVGESVSALVAWTLRLDSGGGEAIREVEEEGVRDAEAGGGGSWCGIGRLAGGGGGCACGRRSWLCGEGD